MRKIFFGMVLLVFIFSCKNEENTTVEQPEANQPVVVHPDTFDVLQEMDDADIFIIDTSKSKIAWHCENHNGLVDLKGGRIFVRKDEPVGAYAEAITKTARDTSITYKLMQGTFNNVLQTADFFDGAHYPLLKFSTTKIQKKGSQYSVDGRLSVRNIIQPLQFELASFRKKGGQIEIETNEIPVNRTLFGMELNSRSFPEKAKDFIFSDTFYVKIVLISKP